MSTPDTLETIDFTAGDFLEIPFTYIPADGSADISAFAERKMYLEHPSSPGGELEFDAIDVDFANGQGKFTIARGDVVDEGLRLAEIKLGATASTVVTSTKFAIQVDFSIGPTS